MPPFDWDELATKADLEGFASKADLEMRLILFALLGFLLSVVLVAGGTAAGVFLS